MMAEAEITLVQRICEQQTLLENLHRAHCDYVKVTDEHIQRLEETITIRTHALGIRAINVMRVDMIQNVILIVLVGIQIFQFFR